MLHWINSKIILIQSAPRIPPAPIVKWIKQRSRDAGTPEQGVEHERKRMVGENGEWVFMCHGLGACPSLPFHLYRFGFPGVPFVPSSPSFLDLFFPSSLSRTSSTEAGPTGPNQEQQDRTRANRINRTEPGPTGPNQDKQDRARPNRTEPG